MWRLVWIVEQTSLTVVSVSIRVMSVTYVSTNSVCFVFVALYLNITGVLFDVINNEYCKQRCLKSGEYTFTF